MAEVRRDLCKCATGPTHFVFVDPNSRVVSQVVLHDGGVLSQYAPEPKKSFPGAMVKWVRPAQKTTPVFSDGGGTAAVSASEGEGANPTGSRPFPAMKSRFSGLFVNR